MNRITTLLFAVVVLFAATHQLPAPISEEATHSPIAKAKAKRVIEAQSSRKAKPSVAIPTPTPTPSKRFAGTWSGIMPEIPWGNVQTELIVDPTETKMEWQESGKHKGSAKTQLNENTLSARVAIGFTTAVWFTTPQADGMTADIRMTAFMNDDHAVFRRSAR